MPEDSEVQKACRKTLGAADSYGIHQNIGGDLSCGNKSVRGKRYRTECVKISRERVSRREGAPILDVVKRLK